MTTLEAPAGNRIDPNVMKTAGVLIVGVLAVVFDTTIVSVALHTLASRLRVPVPTIQWVTTGYLLALGITVPLSAWGMRRFGGKRLWLFSLTLFLVGSIGSSLAWDAPVLIAARVVQGVGGGLMLPVMTTLVMQAAGGRVTGRTVSLVALPALLGPIFGPVVGGLILTHLSWRFMFWVNVPFCLAGLLLAAKFLKTDAPDPARPRLDWLGLVLLAPGIAAVTLGLSNVSGHGGFARADVIIPLVLGAVLLAVFTGNGARTHDALVEMRVLRHRGVAASSAVLFLSGFGLYGGMLLLPLFYQELHGMSALRAGLMLVPQGVGALLCRPFIGGLTDRIGARVVAGVGFAIVGLATLPFAFAGIEVNEWQLALWLVVRGAGLGAVTIPVMAVAYIGLAKAQIAHSSILTRVAQQIGGSCGTAVLAVVLQHEIAVHARAGMAGLATAFDIAFWWSIGFTALAVLLSRTLPSHDRGGIPGS
jgi:EmrB/QacA subfamily drug resistance transporter